MHIVSSHGSFQIPSSRKLSTDDIFFIRATRAANELNAADIITFDLNYSLFEYLKARTFKFCDLNKSCSHFVKSVCSFCFAQVKHMSFLQSNPYKIKLFSLALSLYNCLCYSPLQTSTMNNSSIITSKVKLPKIHKQCFFSRRFMK